MSVKIMGLVWDLDNEVIDRDEKFVLLAYADHADHNGENMFPSVGLIQKKTGYSERSVQTITHKLVAKGFLTPNGKGPKGTNKFSYGGGAKIAGVQNSPNGGAKVTVEGVQPTAPEPSEPPLSEPSVKDSAQLKASEIPELVLFRSVTQRYPSKELFEPVIASIQRTRQRIGRDLVAEDLKPFFEKWRWKGYSPTNLSWLEWAESGQIPQNGTWKPNNPSFEPKGVSVAQSWLNKKQQQEA